MSNFQLYQGDCLEIMPTLETGSVAMVFADLPYGTTECDYDIPVNRTSFMDIVAQIKTSAGALVMTADMKLSSKLIYENEKLFRTDIVWDKVNWCTGHLSAKKRPLRRHEHVLIFGKMPMTYNPQMTVGKPYKVRASAKYTRPHYGGAPDIDRINTGTRHPTTVLAIAAKSGNRVHPAQKPVALLEWLIATYTNPGDLVLDPVMGSGTTGVACANLGRKFIGIEKDATYFAAAKARIEAAYASPKPAQGALAV